MSSAGQSQIGAHSDVMATPVDPPSVDNGAATQEALDSNQTGAAPSRPTIPPRGSFSPTIKRSSSSQNVSPPLPPTRPSQGKIAPFEAPKKTSTPQPPGSAEIPVFAAAKKTRPLSINAGRPLPTPTRTPGVPNDAFSAALSSESPYAARSSSPTPMGPLPPLPTGASSSAPNSDPGVAALRAANNSSPGLKRPLSITPGSVPPGAPGGPKAPARPFAGAAKSSHPLPQQPPPQNALQGGRIASDSPLAPSGAPKSGKVPPPMPKTHAAAPGSLGKVPIAKAGAPKQPFAAHNASDSVSAPAAPSPLPAHSAASSAPNTSHPIATPHAPAHANAEQAQIPPLRAMSTAHASGSSPSSPSSSTANLITLALDTDDDGPLSARGLAAQNQNHSQSSQAQPNGPQTTPITPNAPSTTISAISNAQNAQQTNMASTETSSAPDASSLQASGRPPQSPRTTPRGTPPPIVMSAVTPRGEGESASSKSQPESAPVVTPLSLNAPASGALSPNGPLSPNSQSSQSPRQDGFTQGFVKPTTGAKRAGIGFGSRSAAIHGPSDAPTNELATISPRSFDSSETNHSVGSSEAPSNAYQEPTSSPISGTAEIAKDGGNNAAQSEIQPTNQSAAQVETASNQEEQNRVNHSTEVSTVGGTPPSVLSGGFMGANNQANLSSAPTSALPTNVEPNADPSDMGEEGDTFGEGTMPPPPPEDDIGPIEDNNGPNSDSGTTPSAYTSVFDSQTGSSGTAPTGAFSLLSILGREDQNGPPPPGLTPLPGIFHPVRAPPPLPAGVVHPDTLAAMMANQQAAEQPTDDKKKKKGFSALFGGGKDKSVDKEREKAEKEREKQAEKEKKEREKREKEEKEKREKEEKKAAESAANAGGIKLGIKKMLGGGGSTNAGGPESVRLVHSSSNPSLQPGGGSNASNSQNSSSSSNPNLNGSATNEVSPIKDKLDLYSRLMELLCRPDLHLLNITASLVKRGDVDKQSRAWVHLLTPKGRMVDLLGKVIFTEVDKTDHEGTLFRNNTFSVGLMSAFAHEVGRPYLKNLLAPLLHQILHSGLSYEIQPEKSDSGPLDEDTVDANMMNLLEACGAYVDAIAKSLVDVPLELRRVCTLLRQYVSVKFPTSVNTCVGGFFFLRFLTPAVVSPEGFGVQDQDDPISINMRRPLILISKTLQQISNEMYFSEDYMMSLNSFITENIPIFQQFFQDICNTTVEEPTAPQFVPYSHDFNRTRDDALLRLHAFLHKSLPEIKAVAQVEPAPPGMTYDPIAELEKILNDLGEPQDPKILKAAPVVVSSTSAPDSKKKK